MIDIEKMRDDETVCYCKNVDKKTIVQAIKSGKNFKEIKEFTTACTGRGCREKNPLGRRCSVEIIELINLYSDK